MKDKIYQLSPHFIQNILISIFNIIAYKKRYGGKYKKYLNNFNLNKEKSLVDLKVDQNKRFKEMLKYAIENSSFYKELYQGINIDISINKIDQLPIVNKEVLRKQIKEVYTIPKSRGVISKTGGTTGKSLEVRFTKDNLQERFAILDSFRGKFGYKLGKKTAWFSGKTILTDRDVIKKRYWKTDHWHNVKYYSTFHIKEEYLQSYIDDLLKFEPEYLIGFPSNMIEISKYGLKKGIQFPEGKVKAIFPTAETVTKEMREIIEQFFKANIYDQYSSSEGGPFIYECKNHNLHLELQTGVFEILDRNNNPANEGKLVFTSFTTLGTPLIRYDIGDEIVLKGGTCNCENNNPLVARILGRIDDYIYSPKNGKLNLGNISNTLKDVKGIIKFQVEQNKLNSLIIKLIIDKNEFNEKMNTSFIKNWKERVGEEMELKIIYVDDIPVENSGKYRLVKNNIKHLLH